MKKIMIACAVAAIAVAGQAATVSWGSGSFYAPGTDGSFTTTTLGKNTVNYYVWLTDETTYNAATEATIAALDTKTATGTGKNSGLGGRATYQNTERYGKGDRIYSLILYTYDDGNKIWTIANKATDKVDSLGSAVTFADIASTGAKNVAYTHSAWSSGTGPEPTPEPTTGLLLLLGVAGLALRRKNA